MSGGFVQASGPFNEELLMNIKDALLNDYTPDRVKEVLADDIEDFPEEAVDE